MPSTDSITVLNRVLAILERSFPQYMRYARPYIPAGRESIMQTIEQIAAGEDALAERVCEYVSDAGGLPDHGEFPIQYTDTHDLSIDFLVCEAIDNLKQNVEDLQQSVDDLRQAAGGQSLAAEALGMTKAHLEMLQPLATGGGASTKMGATPAYANDAPVSTEAAGIPHRQEERKLAAGEPHSPR